jgi:hypothetical protein
VEAANKFVGTRICVSAAVAGAAGHFQGRLVGALMLRGRSDGLHHGQVSHLQFMACGSNTDNRLALQQIVDLQPSASYPVTRRNRKLFSEI